MLADPTMELGDVDFSNAGADYGSPAWLSAERLVFYDFEPRVDDCPLLLSAPRDLKVEALHRAELEAKREKEARYAALKGGRSSGGASTASTVGARLEEPP